MQIVKKKQTEEKNRQHADVHFLKIFLPWSSMLETPSIYQGTVLYLGLTI